MDIVERLLDFELNTASDLYHLRKEAVDEVERLRDEVRGHLTAWDIQHVEIERLQAIRDVADLLVRECEGGMRAPSLGLLARLESALAVYKAQKNDRSLIVDGQIEDRSLIEALTAERDRAVHLASALALDVAERDAEIERQQAIISTARPRPAKP